MAKYPEIKIIQNGVNGDSNSSRSGKDEKSSFIRRQASKIFDLNHALFLYASDLINNSSKSIYVGTMSMSLWCVLKLLNASKYLEHITGAEYERYEQNTKTKSYKIDGNTIKVYGENVPIKEGKVRQMRNSFESKKCEKNVDGTALNAETTVRTATTTTTITGEYQGTKELQEIVNSLRQVLERKAPIDDDELNQVFARLNGNNNNNNNSSVSIN